ncbi:MAG TPA: DUF3560 domain-containing protein [Ktedonobacterales bacterium]|nr:DUF3560 domain-containing protein [Ktedonobacterales bacterium]
MNATLYHDPNSCISWLEFLRQPDDATRTALHSAGWRWRPYREAWSTNERWPRFPDGIEISLGGAVDYSAERAERLEERAERHSAEATRRYEASNHIAEGIPLGQPILVGHHSERRHRRDLARIDSHMRASTAERAQAAHLEERAEGSARHQQTMAAPRLIYQRLEAFKADLAHLREHAARYEPAQHTLLLACVQQRIDIETRRLADAGGYTPPTAESTGVQPGDIVQIRTYPWPQLVKRVNRKTLSVVYQDGPDRRHEGTAEYRDVRRIISRCPAGLLPCLACAWGLTWVNDLSERGYRIGGHREPCQKCNGTGYISRKK